MPVYDSSISRVPCNNRGVVCFIIQSTSLELKFSNPGDPTASHGRKKETRAKAIPGCHTPYYSSKKVSAIQPTHCSSLSCDTDLYHSAWLRAPLAPPFQGFHTYGCCDLLFPAHNREIVLRSCIGSQQSAHASWTTSCLDGTGATRKCFSRLTVRADIAGIADPRSRRK